MFALSLRVGCVEGVFSGSQPLVTLVTGRAGVVMDGARRAAMRGGAELLLCGTASGGS